MRGGPGSCDNDSKGQKLLRTPQAKDADVEISIASEYCGLRSPHLLRSLMSESALLSKPVAPFPTDGTLSPLGALLTMSFASLLLELSLTRIFSVILYYHFGFLVISLALLGLGAGGVFAYVWKDQLQRRPTGTLGHSISAINSVVIVLVLALVLRIPVSLEWSAANVGKLAAFYLLCSAPFFFTGLVFSVAFARETERIAGLYGADLVGGALACLLVVPLLNWVGAPNTVLFSATAMAVASAVWADAGRRRIAGALLSAALLVILAANHSGKLIDVVYAKGMRRSAEYARWNAISRITVEQGTQYKWIFIDSDANTVIVNLPPRGWMGTKAEPYLMSLTAAAANVLRPQGEFAIIGPGGGIDVLRAVGSGSPSVTGIEINPLIANTLMRGRYSDYSYHLYDLPEVHLHVSDGRSWMRASSQRFDVVQMTGVDTFAATVAGALALTENNLYTVEAFREYFDHLKPDGILAITRWELKRPQEALRIVSVAMESLHQSGVREIGHNFILVSERPLDRLTARAAVVTVLAKKSAFTPEEESSIQAWAAKYPPLDVAYTPSAPKPGPHSALIASNAPYDFARHYEFDVSPVTDNAPFFFFTHKIVELLRNPSDAANRGIRVLIIIIFASLAAVQGFLILPLALAKGSKPHRAPLLYFIAVGLGYILVEIAFIQRFVLFLGHPTYAFTVVVFLMLLSSAVGSLVSKRWLPNPLKVRTPLIVISAVLLVYLVILHPLLTGLVGLPFGIKALLSGALLIPLGFAMGFPFPTGLRALAGCGENTAEWAWALNAASSVLGSVAAMAIAIEFGFNAVLGCAAAAYLLASALTWLFEKPCSPVRVMGHTPSPFVP
jgi:spermidine synthase